MEEPISRAAAELCAALGLERVSSLSLRCEHPGVVIITVEQWLSDAQVTAVSQVVRKYELHELKPLSTRQDGPGPDLEFGCVPPELVASLKASVRSSSETASDASQPVRSAPTLPRRLWARIWSTLARSAK